MSKYLAEQISEVVVNTHFEDLPQYAVDKAKMLTLDVLASMVGTRKVISSEIARDVAAELGGPEEASIVGYGKKVAAPNAAFANAIQCYGLDFVDDHNESNAHPSPSSSSAPVRNSSKPAFSVTRSSAVWAAPTSATCTPRASIPPAPAAPWAVLSPLQS